MSSAAIFLERLPLNIFRTGAKINQSNSFKELPPNLSQPPQHGLRFWIDAVASNNIKNKERFSSHSIASITQKLLRQ